MCTSVPHPARSHIYTHIPHKPSRLLKRCCSVCFFRHTALEVSPVISGTSCCPAALALFLRAQGSTATPNRPATAPVTSGSPVFRNSWRRSSIKEIANPSSSEFSYTSSVFEGLCTKKCYFLPLLKYNLLVFKRLCRMHVCQSYLHQFPLLPKASNLHKTRFFDKRHKFHLCFN